MDPFSIAASAVALAATALSSVRVLVSDIQAIRDAPEVITDLKDDLIAVETVLQMFSSTSESEQGSCSTSSAAGSLANLSPETLDAILPALRNCQRACAKFKSKLAKWTAPLNSEKKSGVQEGDGRTLHSWDRFHMGIFGKADVEVLSQVLCRCKETLTMALTAANL